MINSLKKICSFLFYFVVFFCYFVPFFPVLLIFRIYVTISMFCYSLPLNYSYLRPSGNMLLPPFGYCEVHASAQDIKNSYGNRHKFVCELSQNILYQYALVVLWFALIVGIVVSIIGLIMLIIHYAIGVFGIK